MMYEPVLECPLNKTVCPLLPDLALQLQTHILFEKFSKYTPTWLLTVIIVYKSCMVSEKKNLV